MDSSVFLERRFLGKTLVTQITAENGYNKEFINKL